MNLTRYARFRMSPRTERRLSTMRERDQHEVKRIVFLVLLPVAAAFIAYCATHFTTMSNATLAALSLTAAVIAAAYFYFTR